MTRNEHPDRILDGLNEEQRRAVQATSGPVAIIAGAGSGKTRVVSHRTAYAVATGVVPESAVLLVTFTEKAASEMAGRVRKLGLARVAARTFHSAALAQLRYFWPSRHDEAELPEVMPDKWRIVAPLARSLPGGYRFTPARDLIDEIEWAKSRRLTPATYASRAAGRTPPPTLDLFVRVFRDYERAKERRGLIDFDDILGLTVELLEDDEEAARIVRSRYSWFTVDEYQDTTPLQARLLELWLGERRDICVVGDEDQTIYTFAGATPEHLTGFERRYPGAVVLPLLTNYRSSPQVLALANGLLSSAGASKRLVATQPEGAEPVVRAFGSAAEEEAAIVAQVKALIAAGTAPNEIAILLRLNAQTAGFEAAFAREGIGYQLRGRHFFERREVQTAMRALERVPEGAAGQELLAAVGATWQQQLGFEPAEEPEGREARERHASLSTLLAIISQLALPANGTDGLDRDGVAATLAERAARERAEDAGGVELLTLHRAKGLEWDAVLIPMLEEGSLPVSQAGADADMLAEERRLLYVGITRARRYLWLSWARERLAASGRSQRREPSRFLAALGLAGRASVTGAPGGRDTTPPVPARPRAVPGAARARLNADDAVLFDALRAWRLERAKEEKVSPFIVAYDAVIADIAERRPRNERELLAVPGIGPGKVDKYGADILAIVAADGQSARAAP